MGTQQLGDGWEEEEHLGHPSPSEEVTRVACLLTWRSGSLKWRAHDDVTSLGLHHE